MAVDRVEMAREGSKAAGQPVSESEQVHAGVEDLYNQRQRTGLSPNDESLLVTLSRRLKEMLGVRTSG